MITKLGTELVKEAFWGGLLGGAVKGIGALTRGAAWTGGKMLNGGAWALGLKNPNKTLAQKAMTAGSRGAMTYFGVQPVYSAATGGVQQAAMKSAYMPKNSVTQSEPFQNAFLGR